MSLVLKMPRQRLFQHSWTLIGPELNAQSPSCINEMAWHGLAMERCTPGNR